MKVQIDLSEYSVETRKRLAFETSDENLLDYLSKDKEPAVRDEVAHNRKTSQQTLNSLEEDEDFCVRQTIKIRKIFAFTK